MTEPKLTRSKEELEEIVRGSPLTCELHSFQDDTAVFYFTQDGKQYQAIYPRAELDAAGIKAGMKFQIHFVIENGDIKSSFVPMPNNTEQYELPPDFKWVTGEEKSRLGRRPWEKENSVPTLPAKPKTQYEAPAISRSLTVEDKLSVPKWGDEEENKQ